MDFVLNTYDKVNGMNVTFNFILPWQNTAIFVHYTYVSILNTNAITLSKNIYHALHLFTLHYFAKYIFIFFSYPKLTKKAWKVTW